MVELKRFREGITFRIVTFVCGQNRFFQTGCGKIYSLLDKRMTRLKENYMNVFTREVTFRVVYIRSHMRAPSWAVSKPIKEGNLFYYVLLFINL